MFQNLSKFNNSWYSSGRCPTVRTFWHIINCLVFQSTILHSSSLKSSLLRLFGAKVGKGVVLKPSINIKYPWNIEIGDYTWLGEGSWLDSLGKIKIGDNCCVSQGVYFCTGSHDWSDPAFGLVVKPIIVDNGVWVGARAIIMPGVNLRCHSVVTGGSVVTKDTEPFMIYAGNPAQRVKERRISSD